MLLAAAVVAAASGGRGALAPPAVADSPVSGNVRADEQIWQGLPAGPGRELVFGLCGSCHSLAIVKQQGLDRETWDETLVWMVKEQGMPPLDPEIRALVLDYLATHYGSSSKSRRRTP